MGWRHGPFLKLDTRCIPPEGRGGNITLVRGFCGLGFHREYGHCIRNGTAYVPPVVVTPHVVVTPQVVVTPHVVVAPHYTPHAVVAPHYTTPVVVVPSVCPHGYYHGANGHCLPY